MVVFTCFHCGDSVKKPSVAKHYQTSCRHQTPYLTCVDCLKDFKGDEYESHTMCVTEEERYSAKGFVPKPNSQKGLKKQKAWTECFQGLLSTGNLENDERDFLNSIASYDNIPRKKAKFLNFIKSSCRHYANKTELIDRVWEKVEVYYKQENAETQQKQDTSNDVDESISKEKKRKHEETIEGDEGVKSPKKKKEKKNSSVDESKAVDNGDASTEAATEEKSSKKKKKSKLNGTEEVNNETAEVEESKPKKSKKPKAEIEETAAEETAVTDNKENENRKKKKRKSDATENGVTEVEMVEEQTPLKEDQQDQQQSPEEVAEVEVHVSFNWINTILNILSAGGESMPLKKLQKKVIKKYFQAVNGQMNDKVSKKFTKKLNKIEGLTIDDGLVRLVH